MSEEEKKDCCCKSTEKLLCVTMITNTVTSLALAVVAIALVGKMFMGPVMARPFMKANEPQKEEVQEPENKEGLLDKIFKKGEPEVPSKAFAHKTITLAEAKERNKDIVVLFYADWCPHCRNFAPTFNKLSKDRALKKHFSFVAINSEAPEAQALMQEYKVEGFPALFLVKKQTDEKKFIPNNLLFGDDAKENLKDIFQRF